MSQLTMFNTMIQPQMRTVLQGTPQEAQPGSQGQSAPGAPQQVAQMSPMSRMMGMGMGMGMGAVPQLAPLASLPAHLLPPVTQPQLLLRWVFGAILFPPLAMPLTSTLADLYRTIREQLSALGAMVEPRQVALVLHLGGQQFLIEDNASINLTQVGLINSNAVIEARAQ